MYPRPSGRLQVDTVAPDSITEWVTSAFAVNQNTGLGIISEFANVSFR